MNKENIYKFLNKPLNQFFIFFVLVFIIFFPVLLGKKIFFQGDILNWSYPNLIFYQEAIKNGESFLWNPYIFSGFPTFLSVTGGYFSPIFYIFLKFFDIFTSYNWLTFFNLVLGGFLLTRILIYFKVSAPAAIIGGLSYILSSKGLMTDLPVINYLPFLPAIILVLIICHEKNTWRPLFFGAILIFLAWASVHFNWLLIVFSGGFVFSLFYPWLRGEISYKKYLASLGRYSIMIFGGTLLASPFVFSIIKYLPYAHQSAGLDYSKAVVGSVKLFDFINFIFPYFYAPIFASGVQFYLGILPLVFIIFSFVIFKQNRTVKFFSLIFIAAILVSINYSPLFWLMQKMPILKFFRGPSRWLALGFFAGSILAGFGADIFLKPDFEKFRTKLIKIFKWMILLIVLSSFIFNIVNYFFGNQILGQIKIYFNQNLYQKTTGLPLDHYYSVIDQMYANIFNLANLYNPRFFIPLLILIMSYLMIEFFLRKKQWQDHFLLAALLAVMIDFLLVLPFGYQTLSRRFFDYQPKIANYILKNPGKVFTLLPGFSEFNELVSTYGPNSKQIFIFQSEILTPNIGSFYKIKTADGFNSLMPKKYSEILALLGSDRAVIGQKLSNLDITLEDKIKLFRERLNLVDLFGIKYIISAYPMEDENLEQVFKAEATDYKIPIYLYKNNNSLPEVYFARSIDFLTPKQDKENLEIIIKKENDFKQKTFIECFFCVQTKEPLDETIKIIQEKNGYLQVKTSNKNAGWLVFNQNNLPGWQVRIDGNIAPIYNANYLFQAIFISEGEHEAIFKYSPFNAGKIDESNI